ncbi:thiol reductant ABC exporter subunit CydC [Sediminicurvatus halobius]|uniref:Thiol reductant ABC exporter subunit CydC n=1 Tax=Sediminicurvatus halobius TaxID=2182432 RepID=A0A2U2N6Q8_9GAMM|nr:thiol reductant ABC exporter subunit CydC [Spiribacter halobius]PWG64871.1 thiol reductant ABC exporter subunit CydC [Spiribacter halobius]UEX78274.1 thiol reductant ABC exporter subunit CydC [Spiribacter halobius]
MRELLPYLRLLRRQRGRLALGALLMFATAGAGIGLLALSGWFITATAVTGALLAAGIAASLEIYVPGGGIRAFAVGRTVARYLERLQNHDAVLRLLALLRARTFARLARLDPATLGRLRGGELLTRLTSDIDRLDGLYLRGLAPPLVAALALALTTALLAIGDGGTALATVAALGTFGAVLLLGAWRLGRRLTEQLAASGARLRAGIVDHLRGLGELLAFRSAGHHRAGLDALDAAYRGEDTALARGIARGEALLHGGVQLAAVLVLLAALSLYAAGTVSGAVAVMMPLAVLGLLEPLGVLPGSGLHLARARAAARRLDAEAERPPAVPAPASPLPVPAGGALTLADVTVERGAGARVLAGVSLEVAAGEAVAVLGVSGSGKSTLAQLACRQLDPSAGSVGLGGIDLRRLDPDALYPAVGYLTQHTDLFAGSVADNLRLADPEASVARLWQLLEAVDLAGFVDGLPEGIDTWIGEAGLQLSGGQARRLALGRLLLRDPVLVVLDEPLSGLDAASARHVAATLERWLAGRTTLLLGHGREALPAADRYLTLRHGRLEPLPG